MTDAPHLSNRAPSRIGPTGWSSPSWTRPCGWRPRWAGAIGWCGRPAPRTALVEGDQELLLPNGARDLAALLSRRHDARALEALADVDPTMKMRERIAAAVSARMEAGAADLEATRKCAGFLALPTNADLGLSLAWESADLLWRWAGDTATDWNHYSKRHDPVGHPDPGPDDALVRRARAGRSLRRRADRECHGVRKMEGQQGLRGPHPAGDGDVEPVALREPLAACAPRTKPSSMSPSWSICSARRARLWTWRWACRIWHRSMRSTDGPGSGDRRDGTDGQAEDAALRLSGS